MIANNLFKMYFVSEVESWQFLGPDSKIRLSLVWEILKCLCHFFWCSKEKLVSESRAQEGCFRRGRHKAACARMHSAPCLHIPCSLRDLLCPWPRPASSLCRPGSSEHSELGTVELRSGSTPGAYTLWCLHFRLTNGLSIFLQDTEGDVSCSS